ncbi:hypothetical protein FBU30_009678 [Linnemannia zychae]|nr:hypothetical protein FBU30_009678 [Linnemannia zychae]
MKVSLILAAIVAATSVSAYQCPDTNAVNSACRQISVSPLVCNNPNVNKEACNVKQCNQKYIDDYSACQCRRSPTQFYEHSANVEGLLRRCGLMTLNNPYGDPDQYRPGQGTKVFTTATSSAQAGVATHIYNGTTYYGGTNTVIAGTTRWVSATVIHNGTRINGRTTWIFGTPSIIRGTGPLTGTAVPATTHPGSTMIVTSTIATRSAAPVEGGTATPTPVQTQSNGRISGGAIAGIVLGCLGALALAGLLAWCWRRKRSQHTATYSNTTSAYDQSRGPTRTVITEKIEPVVVKSGTQHNYGTVPATTTNTYNTTSQAVPANQGYTSNTYNTSSNAVHPSTSYNTTSTTGYNTINQGYNNNTTTGNTINPGHTTTTYNTNTSNSYNSGSGYNNANDASHARGTH